VIAQKISFDDLEMLKEKFGDEEGLKLFMMSENV
jgi:hypothetical protein